MVNLLPFTAPDGTTVLVNQVEGRPSPEELQAQADAARDACCAVNYTTGEVRRATDGTLLQRLPSAQENGTQE